MTRTITLRRWNKKAGESQDESLELDLTDKDELHLEAPGLDGWVSVEDLFDALAKIFREVEP